MMWICVCGCMCVDVWQSLSLGVGIGLFYTSQSIFLIDQCNEIQFQLLFFFFFYISPLCSVAPLAMEFSRQE